MELCINVVWCLQPWRPFWESKLCGRSICALYQRRNYIRRIMLRPDGLREGSESRNDQSFSALPLVLWKCRFAWSSLSHGHYANTSFWCETQRQPAYRLCRYLSTHQRATHRSKFVKGKSIEMCNTVIWTRWIKFKILLRSAIQFLLS